MSLHITPVHKNLQTRVTLLGLEFEDFIAVLALTVVMNILSHLANKDAAVLGIPLSVFMQIVVPLLSVPCLMAFKYGRPRGYLLDLIRSFVAPKAWSALDRDTQITTPYIRDTEGAES